MFCNVVVVIIIDEEDKGFNDEKLGVMMVFVGVFVSIFFYFSLKTAAAAASDMDLNQFFFSQDLSVPSLSLFFFVWFTLRIFGIR